MNSVDIVAWKDLAVQIQINSLDSGYVRAVASTDLFHPVSETSVQKML